MEDSDRKVWFQHIEERDWKVVVTFVDKKGFHKKVHYVHDCGSEEEARRKWSEIERHNQNP